MMRPVILALATALVVGCDLNPGDNASAPTRAGVALERTYAGLRTAADTGRCPEVADWTIDGVSFDADRRGEILYLLAFCRQLTNRLDDALPLYDQSLAAGGPEFWIRYARGQLYLAKGDVEKARADLLRARELDPTHPALPGLLQQVGG